MGCGVLWWVSVVREWVVGFNTMSVWVGLWVDWCVRGGGSSGFRGGGCGCCLVGLDLVDFFFFVVVVVVVVVWWRRQLWLCVWL